jgi:hypothetical protein
VSIAHRLRNHKRPADQHDDSERKHADKFCNGQRSDSTLIVGVMIADLLAVRADFFGVTSDTPADFPEKAAKG